MSGVCALLLFSTVSAGLPNVITFDDVAVSNSFPIPAGYQGLSWSNLDFNNSLLQFHYAGYYYGMISPSNTAYNPWGNPAEVDSTGTNFNFLGVYLTGAWYSNLNIRVEGFRGGSLVYDTTVIAQVTNATHFIFNYLDIDRLYFESYGGQYAGFGSLGEHFVMDNLDIEFVPEPSSLLLCAVGTLTLWGLLRRKRL